VSSRRDLPQGRDGECADEAARVESLNVLSRFQAGFYECLTARADALFELTDALLCTDGPVQTLVGLALAPEHRRGHGALYDALNSGRLEVGRLRRRLAGLPLPRAAGGRIVLAVDVSPWLRPEAVTSPQRLFCHVHGRARNQAQLITGWPYSVVAALETGAMSWTAVLDAVRLGPFDDTAAVTADQVRGVVERLVAAGQWRAGDPEILVVVDAGYDTARLAYQLADLPVELLGRIRSDRVLHLPARPRQPGETGRPPKHGGEFRRTHRRASWRTCSRNARRGQDTVRQRSRRTPRSRITPRPPTGRSTNLRWT
jgi:DDE superfamily endonuclease